MLIPVFKSGRRAQAMLEYMLLMGLVAFLVFAAMRQYGLLSITQGKARQLYQKGENQILWDRYVHCNPPCKWKTEECRNDNGYPECFCVPQCKDKGPTDDDECGGKCAGKAESLYDLPFVGVGCTGNQEVSCNAHDGVQDNRDKVKIAPMFGSKCHVVDVSDNGATVVRRDGNCNPGKGCNLTLTCSVEPKPIL
ncbi:MAG: hypothetical protein HQL18_02305 [Candidatus Omnitrophica bacterium]|nr:hypothetical protein [Candidatus Omnitrophota bacterium]